MDNNIHGDQWILWFRSWSCALAASLVSYAKNQVILCLPSQSCLQLFTGLCPKPETQCMARGWLSGLGNLAILQLLCQIYFVQSLDMLGLSSWALLKKDLYGWLNKDRPIGALPPAEPSFLLPWNFPCTADLNVELHTSMRVPGEENCKTPHVAAVCLWRHTLYVMSLSEQVVCVWSQ